jgi:hypothetical protein
VKTVSLKGVVGGKLGKSIVVLGTYHQITGAENGRLKVDDPDYSTLVESLISSKRLGFIFEEASGLGPTRAQQLASFSDTIGYLDIDPGREERPAFGIGKDTADSVPIDPMGSREMAHWHKLEEHDKREELWLQRIGTCTFEKALLICGLNHMLSMSFRLQLAGYEVEALSYEPLRKVADGLRQYLP